MNAPRGGILAVVSLLALLATGCHRHTAPDEATPSDPNVAAVLRAYREQVKSRIAAAKLETTLFHFMSDAQMVATHQKDGLGLGIKMDRTDIHVGDPLKLHVAYENVAAKGPVSATTCQGFYVAQEDTKTGVTTASSVTFACDEDDSLRDNSAELRQGELKTADIVVDKTRLSFDHPGQYILNLSWQSFRPRDGLFRRGDGYSTVASNMMLITVR